ncbi:MULTISPECIES: MoaD/ThiS family protein [Reichenbachiella]|uniref:Molybdopterin synthase sulfur carrier subunit n=1 Tax=Reichenbachiella agariperforans TaxID=156994 RepID=A0A1M6KV20_REIAG|nr:MULTISPECIES: MoaD/ThiS family protein [Reichenbachiella]RJE74365.1 hypothetical protein BGP76_14465 [Reichenbachiella sp. MSK19-1]SHJ62825.1 molybdopterin synthase sulfur carrier subunit [Reichenbachiella agariperforans]
MEISVLAFGIARDIIKARSVVLEVTDGESVAGVVARLKQQYDGLEKLPSVLLAVNEEYVEDSYVVSQGDELAIIPPVSGG